MVGRVLVGIGIALIAFTFFMEVSVPDPTGGLDRIANNDLLNQRLLIAIAGTAAFIGGWLALLLDAVKRLEKPTTT